MHTSENGLLLRRATEIGSALKLGVRIGYDELPADEFYALLVLQDEQNKLEKEQLNARQQQS